MKRRPLKSAVAEKGLQVSNCLKALAHEVRLGVLFALKAGEMNVRSLGEALDCPQPTLSQHLRLMADRGLLEARREGNHVYYRIRDPRIFDLLEIVRDVFCA